MIVRTLACLEDGVIIWPLVALCYLFSELLLTCNLMVSTFSVFCWYLLYCKQVRLEGPPGESLESLFSTKKTHVFLSVLKDAQLFLFFCTVLRPRLEGWVGGFLDSVEFFSFLWKLERKGKRERALREGGAAGTRWCIASAHVLVRCYNSKL